ncbi:MAG: hypothetical protein HQ510_12920 [Candidatus Marinimicrobia bacterium]|nr:hypothetical protein [Candidatus Neomarinimicrobiota bacterium]
MEEQLILKKKLRAVMVVMIVIIIPGLTRTLSSNAYASVRPVDVAFLFVTGMLTGAFLATLRSYLRIKNK